VTTQPYKDAHFATFPPDLIEPCILAGCPEGGTVLDPFGGAGTTGLVADRHHRNAILIELNPEYAEMARKRIEGDAPLFAESESGSSAMEQYAEREKLIADFVASSAGVACEEARELIAKLRDEGNSIKSVHMIRGADLGVWYALMRRAAEFIERGTPPSATEADRVHQAWILSKQTQGVTSRKAEDGEELMVSYRRLSEKAKDLDRATVRAVYAAISATKNPADRQANKNTSTKEQ
jgi:hypothetical protein